MPVGIYDHSFMQTEKYKKTMSVAMKKAVFEKTFVSWNKGKKLSEEHKLKISQNNGKYWLGKKCLNAVKNRTAKDFRKRGIKGLKALHKRKGYTGIEKKVYDYLLLKGFLFEKQKVVGNRFIVDTYIPSLNLVIEVDGDYWHSLEKNKIRDKRKDIYLSIKGYNLLRLSETEINNGSFRNRIVV